MERTFFDKSNFKYFNESKRESDVTSSELLSKQIESSEGMVEIKLKTFSPERQAETKETDKKTATIFLPGYSARPDNGSLKGLNEYFATCGKQDVHCISTRMEHHTHPNSLYNQAEAVATHIQDSGIEEVTLIGYSNGGAKAIHLAKIIKERNPEIEMRGLVLMNAVSIYEQDSKQIKLNFFASGKQVSWERYMWKKIQGGAEIAGAAIKEIIRSGVTSYKERTEHDINQMAQLNPSAQSIDIPIVLIYGKEDKVTNPYKFAPDVNDEDLRKIRQYLKNELFQNSPGVYLVTGEKEGHHAMPELRNEEVAKAAFYLLQRHHRAKPLAMSKAA